MIAALPLSPDDCYRALLARDARFDGVFFTGVRTTGVYCRPVCRAKTPGRGSCVFYAAACEAERDGYRACLRCRPELAPGNAPVDAVRSLARAAAERIGASLLDEVTADGLAASLGVGARHLRRALRTELGMTTTQLLQSSRLAVAKRLLHDTRLPVTQVAHASGFKSVRRFNAAFAARFGRAPSALRAGGGGAGDDDSITLRLDYRAPYDWDELLAFLSARVTPGVDQVVDGVYRRTVRIDGGRVAGRTGWIEASHDRGSVRVRMPHALVPAVAPLVPRLRALFDLDAHPQRIADVLGADAALARAVARRPGLRVPGAFDPFETTIRGVLGQQVSVRAAGTIAGRLARALGEPVETPHAGLDRLFPTPQALAASHEDVVAPLGMPGSRARTLVAVGRAAADGVFDGADDASVLAALRALPGIGDWTAEYVAMRVLRNPDAFPAGDLVLRKRLGGITARALIVRAEAWRPWRAYAAMHLWAAAPGRDEP